MGYSCNNFAKTLSVTDEFTCTDVVIWNLMICAIFFRTIHK